MMEIHQPKIKMQAVNDQVLVVPLEQQKTAGGIVLNKGMVYDGPQFQVISVGEGRVAQDGKRIPVCVEVGDYIMSAKGGIGFTYQGEKYITLAESSIEIIVKRFDFDPATYNRVVLNG